MVLRVGIKQAPDHALVLRIVLLRFALEEFDAALTQRNRDLDPFVPKNEVLGSRQKIRDDLEVSEGFIRVPNFLAHRFASFAPVTSSVDAKRIVRRPHDWISASLRLAAQ